MIEGLHVLGLYNVMFVSIILIPEISLKQKLKQTSACGAILRHRTEWTKPDQANTLIRETDRNEMGVVK